MKGVSNEEREQKHVEVTWKFYKRKKKNKSQADLII